MEDLLLGYYEKELTFVRELGAEFAKKYPKIAGRLLLEADKCDDPHTERIIEAFAFISGRIHKKIDDNFPEITEAIFNIVYPHYVRPVPSMGIVRFDPMGTNIPPAGYTIEKHTPLFSKPVKGVPCQFRTCQPVTIWPVEVVSATFQEPKSRINSARQTIVISLKTFNEIGVSDVGWSSLRFFLQGQHQHIFSLYELIFNNVCHLELRATRADGNPFSIPLSPEHIKPVGFGPAEGMLPYPKRSFPGYLLLFEYFCFPEKFLFFDLGGLDKFEDAELGDRLEILIYLDTVPKSIPVDRETFCLNAAPVINLFERIAEPIRVEHRKTDYQVVPDIRRQEATEVFSVDKVSAVAVDAADDPIQFRPFYSIRHHLYDRRDRRRGTFWHQTRRPSGKKGDNGTEVFLSFTDLDLKPTDPGVEIFTARVTCTNRDIPGRLPFGDSEGDFDMEIAAPVTAVRSLVKPTQTRRPFMGGGLQWRLISHLSLNYLSLVEGGETALREVLKLYDFDDSPSTRQQIDGIVRLESTHVTKRLGRAFCRGVQTTITFDEDKYVGSGLFLFATILERFLGQYVSVNSFSQMVARTIRKEGALKRWPPRSGNQILL